MDLGLLLEVLQNGRIPCFGISNVHLPFVECILNLREATIIFLDCLSS